MKSSAGGTAAIFLKLYTTMTQPLRQATRLSAMLVPIQSSPIRFDLLMEISQPGFTTSNECERPVLVLLPPLSPAGQAAIPDKSTMVGDRTR